ncbi:MAG: type II toxin-antitoxin system RelE/ParE family toxin [Actinomycetota bacterium]|nr:type II toxin-antitoxin system RelE/ParE family toxin [Actinomycetota bacterium]MDK1016920.1 type II toxin-antitoxin system RelE/ParE family toxin [Actinomycetota bacterium]MDK1037495.1 type II toxin-antitoxin system RelE/ParE family toxin [Actinomycetota bacterium]MDK1102070.1 type II toxin-antitoxin system RelE/ParE family toxin [Actinomycetota bacterium]MDK1292016.1 type II toxin-antitoxin system RelE/ParE family toxin [Actinomycetota bacterium]
MTEPGWKLALAGPARRAIDRLPAKIAVAVLDFILGALLENPDRVGKPLSGDLAGLHSARVGAYRVVYEIDESTLTVNVLYIDHRADIYRPR